MTAYLDLYFLLQIISAAAETIKTIKAVIEVVHEFSIIPKRTDYNVNT